ncbi:MAG: hypothetical protein QT00_C0001G0077 [archaeon GW2011_AR5]|nr:MAG: hypothetical protein QT00_C0001G0077 [archaeon GW2011_AR5]
MDIQVTGWRNGTPKPSGAGYGIRIRRKDREKYFKHVGSFINVQTDKELIKVSVSHSFWKNCNELRNSKIGRWMIENKLAPWEKNKPPSMTLRTICKGRFRLYK